MSRSRLLLAALSALLVMDAVAAADEAPSMGAGAPVVVIPPGAYEPPPGTVVPAVVSPPQDPMAPARGFVFRGELVANYRYALRESWGAGGVELYLGGEHRAVGIAGTFGIDVGRSVAGLTFMTWNWGVEIAGRVTRRLRLGFNPHLGAFTIQDATDGAFNLGAFMVGVSLDGTYDLVLRRHAALYVVAKVGVDYIAVSTGSSADQGALGTGAYAASVTTYIGLGTRLF